MPAIEFGESASIVKSRCGRMMAKYSGVKTTLGNSENERQIIKSNHLVVFAASLQCITEL